MSHPFSTSTRTVQGEAALRVVVGNLCGQSVWFEVTPEPDDEYTITVKQDAERFLIVPPPEQRFHIIHTSNGGPVLVSFDCEDDRAEWCEKQDDTFETFIAVDGLIDCVLTPNIGE